MGSRSSRSGAWQCSLERESTAARCVRVLGASQSNLCCWVLGSRIATRATCKTQNETCQTFWKALPGNLLQRRLPKTTPNVNAGVSNNCVAGYLVCRSRRERHAKRQNIIVKHVGMHFQATSSNGGCPRLHIVSIRSTSYTEEVDILNRKATYVYICIRRSWAQVYNA